MKPHVFRKLRKEAFRLGRQPMMRYQFAVGIGWVHTVTISAHDVDQAFDRAHDEQVKRDLAKGREPPVRHTLFLIDIWPCN